MKGLQHNVIEIKDTQNSEIEKILVFLRPGQHKISLDNTRKDAQEILQKVNIRRQRPRLFSHPRLWFMLFWAAVATLTLWAVLS